MANRAPVEYPTFETQEPPRKKPRLPDYSFKSADDIQPWVGARLQSCLAQQVIPYVDKELSKLPRHKIKVEKLGTEVIGALTGSDFSVEFKKRDGRLSAEFESGLAERTRRLVSNWSKLPGFQQTQPSPQPPSRTGLPNGRYSETPVPLPVIPKARPPQSERQALRPTPTYPTPQPMVDGRVEATATRESPILILSSPSESDNGTSRPTGPTHTSQKQQTAVPSPIHPFKKPQTAIPSPIHTSQKLRAAAPSPIRASHKPRTAARSPLADLDATSEDGSQDEEQPTDSSLSVSPPRTPPPILRRRIPRAQLGATSPTNFRSRAHAQAWREDVQRSNDIRTPDRQRWLSLGRRPYICGLARRNVYQKAHQFFRLDPAALRQPSVFHVDFSQEEIQGLQQAARKLLGLAPQAKRKDPERDLLRLLKRNASTDVPELFAELNRGRPFKGRVLSDLKAYIEDLANRDISRNPSILSLSRDDHDRQGSLARSSRMNSLLLAREVAGHRGYGYMRSLNNFSNEFKKCREEGLELRSEWTNCAGDIATITWVSNDGFICGTTEHSDSHNQQYNKPGNLVVGSCSQGTLRSYPDHRVVRPVVEKGDNSTDAMRQSQDPWLYASVVSSDYDSVYDRAFTSGFDRTVKIWRAEKSGASMTLLGTWPHGGNVNFVVASKHKAGMVATAADVPTAAVRIYYADKDDISNSTFYSFSCSRVVDLDGNLVLTDKWAYFPATIQWGLSPGVQHLLLVGYSPRSLTTDDNDIPEDRRDSGEICLWDGLTGERWKITSGTSQNVFEVLWHPSQDTFIAATSPQGLEVDDKVRTQIRVFRRNDNPEFGGKCFTAVQTLDCAAVDINELTIKPNSYAFAYVTAGCTDGNTYVWDTARGDKPIHMLKHGFPVEEFRGEREREDTGVKFTAWGNSPDRFYTGASDGVVKIWNVRAGKKPLVRDILEVPAPVSFGMFSPDRSKLVIGDASGRVFLLSIDEEDQKPAAITSVQLPGTHASKSTRRPKPIIPHPEPEPPAVGADGNPLDPETGTSRAKAYLAKRQLVLHRNPTVGVVQGTNYAETGLFRGEAHADDDPAKPLLARVDSQQQETLKMFSPRRKHPAVLALKDPQRAKGLHIKNLARDLDLSRLSAETMLELQMARVDLDDVGVPYDFSYEETVAETDM